MSADLLVVGGGIGGAVLANLLDRGGKEVVVLEKSITSELLQEAQVQPWFTNPNQTREQLLRFRR